MVIKNPYPTIANKKLDWFSKPASGHLVHFYRGENTLLAPLTEYIGSGLELSETCIVIATNYHLQLLDQSLNRRGINVESAHANSQYMTFDAHDTLASFMSYGMPDREICSKVIGDILEKAAKNGRPVRVYGEMVMLLWKAGNKNAVFNLEKLWNELLPANYFSLYCAYPELHFAMDKNAQKEIQLYHDQSFSN